MNYKKNPTMNTKQQISAIAVIAALALAVAALTAAPAMTAYAAISCTAPSGSEPPGAQGKDKCNGPALVNENPAGNEPAGFNK